MEEAEMTSTLTPTFRATAPRELDARSGDGIEVRLLWYADTDTVTIEVVDVTHTQTFELAVDPAAALDAFHHPFAHAAYRGVDYEAPLRAHDAEPLPASL